MDPTRFDHLTRRLAGTSGRRALLRALLGAALGGAAPVSAKQRAKDQGPGKGENRSQATATPTDQVQEPLNAEKELAALPREVGA